MDARLLVSLVLLLGLCATMSIIKIVDQRLSADLVELLDYDRSCLRDYVLTSLDSALFCPDAAAIRGKAWYIPHNFPPLPTQKSCAESERY